MNNWLLVSMCIAILVVIITYFDEGDDNKNGFAS
jgi:hypothetical protein